MLTNNFCMPEIMEDVIQPKPYMGCGGADYSATSLIQSPRQVQLYKRHIKDVQEDLTDHWAFFLGSAIHEMIERTLERYFPTKYLVERKVTRFDLGRRVVMKVDAHDIEKCRVYDHKTAKIGNRKDISLWTEFKQEWKDQLMINAYFLEEEGYPVKELCINQIFLDWKPYTAKMMKANEYPQAPAVELVVPAPSQEERKKFYLERLQMHIDAENIPDDELPYCTMEECWASNDKWSVQLKSTGRSRKLCDTREEAEAWFKSNIRPTSAGGYEIVLRPACRLKCDAFCSVAPYCNQYQEYLNGKPSIAEDVPF